MGLIAESAAKSCALKTAAEFQSTRETVTYSRLEKHRITDATVTEGAGVADKAVLHGISTTLAFLACYYDVIDLALSAVVLTVGY